MNVKVDDKDGETSSEAGVEEQAFNAAVNALNPGEGKNPLEGEMIPEKEEEKKEGEVEGEGEKGGEKEETTPPAADPAEETPEAFLGDLTADEVLEYIQKIDGLEESLYEKVSQKVFGKMGDLGRQLKALQEREFTFNPDKLTKLNEIDEGIAAALKEDLAGAFSGQSFDSESVMEDLRKSVFEKMNPYVEERLMKALAPNAEQVVKTKEFGEWYFDHAKQDVRDTFEAWDSQSRMDGIAMAQAFKQFDEWKDSQKKAKEEKRANLNKAVEEKPSKTPPKARQSMTEEEAFAARMKEVGS